ERRLDRRASEARIRRARDARHLGLGEPGECRAHLSLDDGAPDAERSIAEHADPLPDRAGALKAQSAQRGDRAADSVILGVVGKGGRAHRAAQDARSPAAVAAALNPSIIATSPKSRWARVRPARPIASR